MKKICFIIPDLNMAGSQRVFLHLMNNLDRNFYKITLLLINRRGEYFEKLKRDIEVIELNCRVRNSMLKIIKKLRKIEPDIVISTIVDLNLYLGLFVIPFFKLKNIKFIARESHVLSMTHGKFLKKILKRLSMRNFNYIIAQSQDMYKDMIENFKMEKGKCKIINNPINSLEIEEYIARDEALEYSIKDKKLIYVGRITYQKGIDYLVPIMKELKDEAVKLYIIGDGEEKEKLEKKIKKYGLENKIILLGKRENPYVYISKADLFLLPSRYEGFPNVLIEANACGKYCIVNKALGGVNEIIENGVNGEIIIFEDFKKAALKIKEALEKEVVQQSKTIREMTLNKYSLTKILQEYNKIFLK